MRNKVKNSSYHDTFPLQAFLENLFLSHPFLLVEKRDILKTASNFFSSDIFIITFPLSSYITIIPKWEKNVKFFSIKIFLKREE